MLARYSAALAALREPRVFTLEYTLEQTGPRTLEQAHRIFRTGRDERDETIAVNGTRATRPQIRIFRGRPYRYTVAALAPKPAQYDFAYAGTRRDGHHLDYVFRLRAKQPGAFRLTEVAVDGLSFLPGTVAFATRDHGGSGSVSFGKQVKWWVASAATAAARAPGGGVEHERLTFSRWRFPPSLPASTFSVPRALPSPPPSPALRRTMVHTDAQTALARRESIADALRRSARRDPERIALRFGERSWTYAALDRGANRVARRLVEAGLRPGDRVAAYGRNSDAYLLTWLGALRAGLIHVPVNYALKPGELGYIVRQSGAAALVCDAALAPNAAASEDCARIAVHGRFVGAAASDAAGGAAFDVLASALDEAADATPLDARYAHPVAQILYTSGTTAEPKGAVMTHGALLAHYASCMASAAMAAHDRSLDALPLYHSAQMHVVLMPHLLLGATSVLIEAPEPATVLRLIEEHRITSFFAPPTVWISLLRHDDFDRRDLSSLRNAYYGASIMPVPVLQELRRRLPAAGAWNLYGQSEIGPLATVLRPEEHDQRPASAGRPILNVETRVVDEDMRDTPPGVNGEIVHRSPQLLSEYWNKPEETAQAFAGGWFHSGDVGYRDEAGYLYVVDRLKDVINTGGIVVSSREIEETLFAHPAVYEVAVIALPDPRWVEAITAVVVLRPGAQAGEAELLAHAGATLAPFKVPKRIIFTDSLPRNTAGKLLKRELRATYS